MTGDLWSTAIFGLFGKLEVGQHVAHNMFYRLVKMQDGSGNETNKTQTLNTLINIKLVILFKVCRVLKQLLVCVWVCMCLLCYRHALT